MDALPGSPWRAGQLAREKPQVSSRHMCPQTEGQATRGCRLPAPASTSCSPCAYAHTSSTRARVCALAARDVDKTAIEICYIYLQPSRLPARWHDREPEALQALAGLRRIQGRGVEEPISTGSDSRGHGVGHEDQKMGFPCLISQQGHCPRGPAPDPGEGLGVGWRFLAHLPSPHSPRGDLAAHPEQDRQGEEPALAPEGTEAAVQGPACVTGTAATGSLA